MKKCGIGIGIGVANFICLLLFLFGLTLAVPKNTSTVHAASATDVTQLSSSEQIQINNQILSMWGTPIANKFKPLHSGHYVSTLNPQVGETQLDTSGDVWYYLVNDIKFTTDKILFINLSQHPTFANVRIVLNGYSISGDFRLSPSNKASTLSIIDKVPGKSGTGYNYNPNPVKYFKYNSITGGYTDYVANIPGGIDVTDMPTWQANTYIKVTGSTFSPNALQNSISTTAQIVARNGSTVNLCGIQIVGCKGDNSILGTENYSYLNIFQCNVIGNQGIDVRAAICFFQVNDEAIKMVGCNVYGNRVLGGDAGVRLAETVLPDKSWDIGVRADATFNSYKNNIGVLADLISDPTTAVPYTFTKAVYLKDVNFNTTYFRSLNLNSFKEKVRNINAISGRIELIYNINLTYAGNSPNLNFIVHGKDNSQTPKSGFNTLDLVGGSMVNSIVISGLLTIYPNANVASLFYTGGQLIDLRNQINKGSSGGSTSKVILNNDVTVNVVNLQSGDYLGTGLLQDNSINVYTPTTNNNTSVVLFWIIGIGIVIILILIVVIIILLYKMSKYKQETIEMRNANIEMLQRLQQEKLNAMHTGQTPDYAKIQRQYDAYGREIGKTQANMQNIPRQIPSNYNRFR